MKCIINPRPEIDENLIKPFREMEDVLSLSCVVGDADGTGPMSCATI